jgi:cell division protein FtsA
MHMRKKQRVTVVDVGTTKVCCVIADATGNELEILGMGVSPNNGLRRGVIVDVEDVTQAIRSAVGEAEAQAGTSVSRCFISLSGDYLASDSSRGTVAINGSSPIITEHDVERVIENARRVGVPDDRQVLHVIPKGYTVNDVSNIKNPVGLSGLMLAVDTHIITAAQAPLQNLLSCLEIAELDLEDDNSMVVSSVATSWGFLEDEEKELGVALVDIGGGTTDLAVWKDGHLKHTGVLCVGGGLITYDVATALRVPLQEAERLVVQEGLSYKEELGSLEGSSSGENRASLLPSREIVVTSLSGLQPQPIRVSELAEIIELRLLDIFDWLREQLIRLNRVGVRPASIVLTGGVADMKGVAWVAEQALGYPVRVVRPDRLRGLPATLRNPAYSAALGLLLYGVGSLKGNAAPTRNSTVNRAWQQVVSWLKEYIF